MQEGDLLYHQSTIHYRFSKGGPQLLICWHGYDESSASYLFLQTLLKNYSVLCIDLPFHGQTAWNEKRDIKTEDLLAIIDSIRAGQFAGCESISLLGFSLGGRMALSILQSNHFNINKVVLLAPDGIRVNFWYWLSTQTKMGNRLFRLSVSRPSLIFGVLSVANKLHLINQSVFKFIRYYLQDENSRLMLYKRWTVMRKIKPDLTQIKKSVKKNGLVIDLVYGEYDRIIRYERAAGFCKELEGNCRLHLIGCGHQVLHDNNADFIVQLLNERSSL